MVNVFMVEVILDVCAMVVEVARESQGRGFCGGGSVVVVVMWGYAGGLSHAGDNDNGSLDGI